MSDLRAAIERVRQTAGQWDNLGLTHATAKCMLAVCDAAHREIMHQRDMMVYHEDGTPPTQARFDELLAIERREGKLFCWSEECENEPMWCGRHFNEQADLACPDPDSHGPSDVNDRLEAARRGLAEVRDRMLALLDADHNEWVIRSQMRDIAEHIGQPEPVDAALAARAKEKPK